jgi:flagellar biosynthetic protein FlhB
LAVALRYDQTRMSAPVVVAKGANLIAQRIKDIAKENGVAVVENKPLAQVLYRMVDIMEAIPDNLYQAVAEVLAYVYRLKSKQAFH